MGRTWRRHRLGLELGSPDAGEGCSVTWEGGRREGRMADCNGWVGARRRTLAQNNRLGGPQMEETKEGRP